MSVELSSGRNHARSGRTLTTAESGTESRRKWTGSRPYAPMVSRSSARGTFGDGLTRENTSAKARGSTSGTTGKKSHDDVGGVGSRVS